jgi:hypothetical protein
LDQETIVSFISLCNRAQKNNKLIIDARYHFFVRSLEGCYLAMSTNPKLFLTREKYYKENNNNFCVFEIAICDDCGKFAFVGKIENNHLVQSGKLEEKVNYYFLASDENNEICNDDDDYDTKKTQHYYLCKKCGAIIEDYKFKNIPCECGIDNYIEIVQAKDLKIGARCATCHTGKYQRFYLGNEAATSVLATSLYEELPELTYEEEPKRDKNDDNNIFFIKNNYKKRKSICRQFLAFSDGRQEAAKFACYLSKSYNEFLRRRGICQIVNEYKDTIINSVFTIPDFVNKLTSLFSNKKSFAKSNIDDDNLTAISQENAWVAMLNELARFNSPTSLTQLGILQFEYLGNTKDIISNIAKKYKTTDDIVKNLLNLLVFEIVKDGALSTNTDTDINDDDREYIFFTPNQKFISYTQDSKNKKNYITDWMPKFDIKNNTYHKTNKLYYIMKSLNIDSNESIKFLNDYFDYLKSPQYNSYCLLDNDGAYVMPAKYFRVKIAGDPSIKWYKCNKCGKISQFNINGHCISPKCNNIVEEINPFELNKDNHFAKLYSSNSMSPLFIKEHTAQLSKRESCDYQQQFIRKEINALSCSTTFEMGVDVGDLETVFLRDVPPLPSNYAQRAGRAGRSINAVAYALTFAKLSSHDLSYFKEPEKMICGKIMPPIFKLDNEKIIRRHIYDIALSMFFANNQDLYNHNDAEKFINEKGYIKFTNWLKSYPEELKDLIIKSIPNVNNLHSRLDINNFGWLDQFIGDDGIFTILLKEYENNINIFEKLIEKYKKNNDSDSAKMLYKCQTKLENYKKNKLIDFLARGNILPRYGFPIDTVELEQYAASPNIDKLKLNRDLQIAIAEYAPSSEVIADGNLYTSRYIKKSNISKENKEWYTAYIGVCPNCQGLNYSITPVDENGIICTSCGKTISSYDFKESIEPRSGFITEKETKKVPLTSQEKNYKSEDYYIGNKEAKIIEKHMFKFNGINITIESTTNDSLLVKSINYFYVCPKCGFSYAQDEIIKADKKATKEMQNFSHVIETINKHEGLFGPCDCYKLNRYFLHHTFNTDVAKIDFGCDTSDYDTMVSTMYAILNSISKYLNIERKDIKACLSLKFINSIKNYSIIIYDSVPGGAGHSRRLVTNDGKLLYNILKEALSNMKNCSCDPSCYNCLRSYENQKIHDKLNRHLVIKFLENFMGKIETIN